MFDIPCPKCGEPVDNDELHRIVESKGAFYASDYEREYNKVRDDFRKRGCEAIDCTHNPNVNVPVAEATSMLMELMPDDFDGVVAMLQDGGLV